MFGQTKAIGIGKTVYPDVTYDLFTVGLIQRCDLCRMAGTPNLALEKLRDERIEQAKKNNTFCVK